MTYRRAPRVLLSGTVGLWAFAGAAMAQSGVTIPAMNLKDALDDYIRQSGAQLIYNVDDISGLRSHEVRDVPTDAALSQILLDTGVFANRDRSGAVIVSRDPGRRSDDSADIPVAETVVVTGSRIQNGRNPPTPVTTVSAEQLDATTPGGIPEALNKLPIFTAGTTPNNATTGANGRGNNAPGYFLNLRNLGAIRTLVLEDGHRVPGTFYDTMVDIDMLPQILVQRVEVVAGGASAVYGSDAVTGVVNFILDKKFEGLKGVFQGGISNFGDARSFRVGVAGGEDIGARGHLIWSVEYRDRDALPDDGARPLGLLGTAIVGAGTAASPYALAFNARQGNTAPGGLIVSGPGKGMQFLSNGSLAPFNPGTPTATVNVSVGGDGGIAHNEYLLPVSNTAQAFAHYLFDFSDSLSGYVEARYATARSYEAGQIFTNINGSDITTNGSGAQYPITIYSGNAFLTPAEQAFLFPAGGATSFQENRFDNDLQSRLSLDQHTGAFEAAGGLKGTVFDKYNWDFNYTHGETRTQLTTRNNVNTARFYAALDAVKDPTNGNIVCNVSITAPGAFPGCVPLNLFGQGSTGVNSSNASQAALNYVGDTTDFVAHNGLDDFSANITGPVFDDWAGPVKVAVGVEYRLASLNVTTTTPNNTFNGQYLRLAPAGTFASTAASPTGTYPPADLSYFKEVQAPARGSENISEANAEFEAPVLRNLPLVELLSINGAARYTQYSTGGQDPTGGNTSRSSFSASTWKVGGTWQVTDELRVRGARSRDIRAPTLWDLYQGPVVTTSGITDGLVTGVSGSVNTQSVGNPALKPEVAHNSTAGLIYTPDWLADFSVSADYFHIDVDNEIAAVSGNNTVVQVLCLASPGGSSPYCNLIQRPISYSSTDPTNFPSLFYSQTQNFQKQWTEGIDFEVNYTSDISSWTQWKGLLNFRLLWTHTSFLKTLGLPGAVITDAAGANNAPGTALPSDKASLMANYAFGGISVDVLERYYASIRQSANPSLVFNIPDLPAYFQTDINVAYDFDAGGVPFTGFLNVSNLLDARPGILQVPSYTGSLGINYPVAPYEDIIGRYFTIGLRFKMN